MIPGRGSSIEGERVGEADKLIAAPRLQKGAARTRGRNLTTPASVCRQLPYTS